MEGESIDVDAIERWFIFAPMVLLIFAWLQLNLILLGYKTSVLSVLVLLPLSLIIVEKFAPKADGEKLAPNTETTDAKPVKMMLKDIKGKKRSFARNLSKTEFYSGNIDVSSSSSPSEINKMNGSSTDNSTLSQLHSLPEENSDSQVNKNQVPKL